MASEGTKMAINIGIMIVVMIFTIWLIGGTIIAKLFEVSQRQTTTEFQTDLLCKFRERGYSSATFYQGSQGVALDSFVLNLKQCFNEDERREIGTPAVKASDTCPSDQSGFNIYLLGPTESHYVYQGKSYRVTIERSGSGTYPDACVTMVEVS